jgi:hypothetical protein
MVLVITAILAAGLAYKTGVATAENNNDEIQTVEDRSTATIPEKQITMLTPGICDTAGPIEVESTGGVTIPTAYARLQFAFNAINSGTHTGTITIDVCGNTTETGTASLNASGSGSANYTSITIRPVGARTISGSIAGAALIQLNGADNVTINGLNSGGNSLTISNTSTSNTAGTSTIRLVNDATNNTITNCTIQGSSTTAPSTNGGTIFISTATSSGNDNNTFSNNKIGPAGTNLPTKAVYAAGSTGTTAAYNNNITFSNNEIFDYFSNSTSSFGVYLANGNDNWTFSNNKFYQTAARTQTTGALFHAAINVAGNLGNTSHTFNGNIIGFANASGTGTYSITLGNAGRFAGISISSAGAGGNYNIQNNTITNISVGGSGYGQNTIAAFAAILMVAGGTATISNNIIGSTTTSGALSYSTNSTSASDVYGIYLLPPANVTISNNTVAGITATNTSTGAILIYGIRAFTNFVSTNTIQNNTVGHPSALIQNNATSSASSRVIGIASQSGASVVTGNTVRNLTMSAPNTGTGILASVIGILSDNAQATTNTISQNTIHSLSNTNPTANVGVVGLAYNGNTAGGPYTVARNFIHSLSVSTIGTGYLRGIFHNAGRYVTYQNNMIRLGIDAAGNSVTGAYNIAGYEETVGSSNNFYHNTIYIGGNAGTSNQFSYAFLSSATPLTRNFINNAFINNRSISGGAGANVAAAYAGTLPNPAGLNSNYNFYYSQNANTLIRNGSTNYSLSSWQNASGNQDGNSFQASSVAQFNLANPTGNSSTVDLHIANTGSSILEQSGTLISSVTDDFDGQNRATFTPVDAGADAANSTQFNTIPPVITYTPLKNTTSTSNRSLNVTITDPDGVASGALAPKIYYRKGTGGSYVSTQCSGTQPSYTCTIDYSLVGGVIVGNIIQYFVVAQDTRTPPNLSANPANGFGGSNVNSITPPTNPNQYRIAQGFSGTVNVGSGQSITSLTNPGGLFDQLNNNVLTGNLVVNITSDLTNESGQIGLNQLTEEGAGNYTITIKPSGAPRTISSTTGASQLIWLNGADRVTIDGSLSGGTDRNLTLSLLNPSANTIVVWVASLGPGEGANNITIKNCIIQNNTNFNNSSTNVNYGIYVGRTDLNAFGPDNDNLTIQNNLIQRTSIGIQAAGDTTGLNDNTIIADNIIGGTASADFIGRNGITIAWSTGATITRNTVRNIANSATVNLLGIFVSRGTVNSGIISNSVSNMDASYTNTTNTLGNGSTGIFVETSLTSSNVTVANNFIYDIRGTGGAVTDLLRTNVGIRISGTGTGGVNVWNNSVNLFGSYAGINALTITAAFMVNATSPTNLNVRNNIFVNSFDNTTVTTDNNYAIYTTSPATIFSSINYNDYFVSGTVLGVINLTNVPDLLALQAATGQDTNSISVDPLFLSDTDLHLQVVPAASPALNAGVTITGITNDFDNDPRPSPSGGNPEIGADEVVQATSGSIAGGTYYNVWAAGGNSLSGDITVNGYLALTGQASLNGRTLTLGCNATVFGVSSTNYLASTNAGKVAKRFCSTGSFTFPIGLSGYSPVDVTVTTLNTNPSTLSALVINGPMPGLNPSISLHRRWYLELTGNMVGNLTFHYLDGDVYGIESDYRIYRITPPSQTPMMLCTTPCVNTTANTLSITGVSQFSLWSGGQSQIVTADRVTVGGRVMTADGRGIRNALVTMIESDGTTRTVTTGPFGYYRFADVAVGQNVVLTVTSKRFNFDQPTQVVYVIEDMEEVNFVARE